MYKELATIREIVDLTAQSALDRAETFLTQQGYVVLRRTDTSLWVTRDRPGRSAERGVLALTVLALPQLGGGVQVKVRGNDQDWVRERQAEWRKWAESLPKKKQEELGETVPLHEPEGGIPSGNSEEERSNASTREWIAQTPGPQEQGEVQDPAQDLAEGADSRKGASYSAEGSAKHGSLLASYEYKMVYLSLAFSAPEVDQGGDEVALYLQSVANEQAAEGWEFYRVDALGAAGQLGRLATLFGGGSGQRTYYVATFRRPK